MPRTYDDGEIWPYRGREVVLRIVDRLPPPVEDAPLRRNAVALAPEGDVLLLAENSAERRVLCLRQWYTAETENLARALVPRWAKAIRVRPRLVDVGPAKTRWGSCSHTGRIFLNARLAMLSDPVAEYVVVHELCHMKEMNHSQAFWNEMETALPGAAALRKKLREEERNALL